MDCERCVYYDEDRKDQPCCSCHGQNFEEANDEQREAFSCGHEKGGEWISVDERLPERTGKYLVFTYNRRLYIDDFIDHYCDGNPQFDDYKVTHWMPLPEAPKMKGGE